MKIFSQGFVFFVSIITLSCSLDNNTIEPVITDPLSLTRISSDTITSEGYLGVTIGDEAELTYTKIQNLPVAENINYLNVVSNFVTDFSGLNERLPLYSYFLMDETIGTDSGVQVSLENGKVTSIYLGSGKSLTQWPTNANSDASLRIGDSAGDLYAKLAKIKANKDYTKKFERVLLLTKNVSLAFDSEMAQSPQWYFARKTVDTDLEEVQIYFETGKVEYIVVNRYSESQ